MEISLSSLLLLIGTDIQADITLTLQNIYIAIAKDGSEGYGPIRKYDIVFDDGDVEPSVGEVWVSKKSEYEVSVAKPEDTWIGVTNVRFEYSNDDYARLIGWYKTTVGDVNRVYTSLRSALRAYDKFIIESKGKDKVSAKELNFPEEHF